jgi:hypothetical protein
LATVSQFTSREKLLYDSIQNKEGELCKLRKKCWHNLKFVTDVEGNTLIEDISTSLNAEGIRLLKGIFEKISTSQRPGSGTLKVKCWLCMFLHTAQIPAPSYEYCLFHLGANCNSYLFLASEPMCVVRFSIFHKICLLEIRTVV